MLDPQRVSLDASSVGFLQRTGQKVDWDAFKVAMQTDYNNQNSAVQVRRERDAAKTEIRVMGGELKGFESNELILTQKRQQRQINGYPLRQFSAEQPAVVLPRKYGGFPLYNRNQLDYPEIVSVFTEPLSAPLQSRTELLSRMGQVALTNDAARPYEEEGFVNPMNRGYEELAENENQFRQREHLRNMSAKMGQNKRYNTFGNTEIYMNAQGQPMSQASDAVQSEIDESINGFGSSLVGYEARQAALLNRESTFPSNAELRATPNNNLAILSAPPDPNLTQNVYVTGEKRGAPEVMDTATRIVMGLNTPTPKAKVRSGSRPKLKLYRRLENEGRSNMESITQALYFPTPTKSTGMQAQALGPMDFRTPNARFNAVGTPMTKYYTPAEKEYMSLPASPDMTIDESTPMAVRKRRASRLLKTKKRLSPMKVKPPNIRRLLKNDMRYLQPTNILNAPRRANSAIRGPSLNDFADGMTLFSPYGAMKEPDY